MLKLMSSSTFSSLDLRIQIFRNYFTMVDFRLRSFRSNLFYIPQFHLGVLRNQGMIFEISRLSGEFRDVVIIVLKSMCFDLRSLKRFVSSNFFCGLCNEIILTSLDSTLKENNVESKNYNFNWRKKFF